MFSDSFVADRAGNVYLSAFFDGSSLRFGDLIVTNQGNANNYLARYDKHGALTMVHELPAENVVLVTDAAANVFAIINLGGTAGPTLFKFPTTAATLNVARQDGALDGG